MLSALSGERWHGGARRGPWEGSTSRVEVCSVEVCSVCGSGLCVGVVCAVNTGYTWHRLYEGVV